MTMKWLWIGAIVLLAGCSGVPKELHPVTGFDSEKYLGHWNEIARLDHSFERGLTDVTADYRRLPDGRIEVTNRGFDAKKNKWKEAKGVARFQGKSDVGQSGGVNLPAVLWRIQRAGARSAISLCDGGGTKPELSLDTRARPATRSGNAGYSGRARQGIGFCDRCADLC